LNTPSKGGVTGAPPHHRHHHLSRQFSLTDSLWRLAPGPGSCLSNYLPACGQQPPHRPVKGQMLLFDAEPETLCHMVLDGDHYLIHAWTEKFWQAARSNTADLIKPPAGNP